MNLNIKTFLSRLTDRSNDDLIILEEEPDDPGHRTFAFITRDMFEDACFLYMAFCIHKNKLHPSRRRPVYPLPYPFFKMQVNGKLRKKATRFYNRMVLAVPAAVPGIAREMYRFIHKLDMDWGPLPRFSDYMTIGSLDSMAIDDCMRRQIRSYRE